MLSKMSIKYDLSQRYTNHSLRVTGMQALDDNDIDGRHIIRITGHKNEDSIKHYARKFSAARKRNISSILSSVVDKENVASVGKPSSKKQRFDQVVPVVSSTPTLPNNQTVPTTASIPVMTSQLPSSSRSSDIFPSTVPSAVSPHKIDFDISSSDTEDNFLTTYRITFCVQHNL